MNMLEPTSHQLASALVLFVVAAAYALRLILQRRLDAQHAAILIILGVLTLVFVMVRPLRQAVMNLFGIGAPASALFLLALIVQGVAMVFFSMRLTQQAAQVRRLVQEVALLTAEGQREPATPGLGENRPLRDPPGTY